MNSKSAPGPPREGDERVVGWPPVPGCGSRTGSAGSSGGFGKVLMSRCYSPPRGERFRACPVRLRPAPTPGGDGGPRAPDRANRGDSDWRCVYDARHERAPGGRSPAPRPAARRRRPGRRPAAPCATFPGATPEAPAGAGAVGAPRERRPATTPRGRHRRIGGPGRRLRCRRGARRGAGPPGRGDPAPLDGGAPRGGRHDRDPRRPRGCRRRPARSAAARPARHRRRPRARLDRARRRHRTGRSPGCTLDRSTTSTRSTACWCRCSSCWRRPALSRGPADARLPDLRHWLPQPPPPPRPPAPPYVVRHSGDDDMDAARRAPPRLARGAAASRRPRPDLVPPLRRDVVAGRDAGGRRGRWACSSASAPSTGRPRP